MLIAHISAQLIDQLICPRFPLLAQILTSPPSSNRWFSKENTVCYLPTTELICFISLSSLLPCQLFSGPIWRVETSNLPVNYSAC